MPSLGPSPAPLSSDSDDVRLLVSPLARPAPVPCAPHPMPRAPPPPSVTAAGGSGRQNAKRTTFGDLSSFQAFRLRGWQVLKHLRLPLRIRKQTTQEGTS